jgi:two-component system sensor histidine kinase NreB
MITLKNFIQELGNRFVIQINFTHKGSSERLPPTIEIALYRIAQEALINATKYSKAERIDVVIEKSQEFVSLSIIDYGNGFIYSSDRKGVGIYSMEERASILGGKFSIVSDIGEGTQVKVKIPI